MITARVVNSDFLRFICLHCKFFQCVVYGKVLWILIWGGRENQTKVKKGGMITRYVRLYIPEKCCVVVSEIYP